MLIWTAKAFPDPFAGSSYGHDTLSKLHCIFSRIILFIEDYVSKATDPYPPRAYLALPNISGGDRLFKGKTVGIKPVSFSSLMASEKRRFVGAFLKHEMICKVYNPQVWSMLKDTHYATLLAEEEKKLLFTELKELYCVHEYMKAAYGAIFAHCQDSWLPDRPAVSASEVSNPQGLLAPTKYGLLYPDTVYFNPAAYFEAINDTRFDRLPNLLPYFGLDLLTKILLSFKAGQKFASPPSLALGTWANTSSHDTRSRFLMTQPYSFGGYIKNHAENVPQLFSSIMDSTGSSAEHLPTMDDLDEQRRAASEVMTPSYERPRRRSKKWQDWYSGRSLESPLEQEAVEWGREIELVPYNADSLGRFFEKQTHGKIATFWRREGDKN
ncbi:uncharacterized protein NECHADRAFT_89123 [Fusarium vanettenii 77-13-4]|uniref:Uncharacterized protein n=1 Tax=Fusarium vanettenii (strain ATCC MYA-4622 / CBS 123669 / FGSC 9596 / NRRL 45880 / 77-13-4) TaxID=660122 RepID=C7ZQA6_FUSV7|nr:uncharacterized protein NECHADRAFT_89123 [Fusarium vanettenii 77-13-4]EEU33785.1 hypothetical protein NECHADRAFT_89123 [Fusarium vanettenii 77-13-4]